MATHHPHIDCRRLRADAWIRARASAGAASHTPPDGAYRIRYGVEPLCCLADTMSKLLKQDGYLHHAGRYAPALHPVFMPGIGVEL